MKLIGSLTSPFVRKVRIVLAEKKLDYKFELEDVWSTDTRIAEANPLGKVPCLVMDGGLKAACTSSIRRWKTWTSAQTSCRGAMLPCGCLMSSGKNRRGLMMTYSVPRQCTRTTAITFSIALEI